MVLSTSPLSLAQAVTLTLKPDEIQHETGVRLQLILNSPSDSAPAAVQWEFKLLPGSQILEIEEGKAVKDAGKMLVCKGAKCLAYGWSRTTIPNGPIAMIRVTQGLDRVTDAAQSGYRSHSRNEKQIVQIVDVSAAALDGTAIKVVSDSAGADSRQR